MLRRDTVRFLWIAALLASCSSAPEGSRDDSVLAISLQEKGEGVEGGSAESRWPNASIPNAPLPNAPLPNAPLPNAPQGEPAILVELFTSQGCSSCPPADELLGELDAKLDAKIIPLSFHVDYWNYIGWRDPFSSKRWSSRQKTYAKKISNGRGYTPQLVVNGVGHVVGSRFEAIRGEVRRQSKNSSVVAFEGGFELVDRNEVKVSIDSSLGSVASAKLVVALYENGLETTVTRGENRGRSLQNNYVVRDLQELGALRQGLRHQEAVFAIDSEWQEANLGVVVFAQDLQSLEVVGVQRLERL